MSPPRRKIRASALLWLLALCSFVAAPAAMAGAVRNVLILYSNNRLVPGNVAVDRGLRAELTSASDRPVLVFSEFLDTPDFGGPTYEATLTTYLREKYSLRRPEAIVAVSDNAVDFLLRNRADLFPDIPVVHSSVSKAHLQSLPALPADVIGVPIEYDFAGTIAQALRWHPEARRLLVVTGTSGRDRGWEARLRREAPAAAPGVAIEFLAGLPTPALLARLAASDRDSVVFTPGYYEDGDGRLFNPRDAVAQMAASSGAPIYGPLETFLGTGVVGGRSPSFEAMGRQAAQTLNALFAGATPASIALPRLAANELRVDWRQVRRWGIAERAIPADAIVQFREPTFWQAYRTEAIVIAAVLLFQAGLIATLVLERRRRRSAEFAVQQQRSELAHASRLAIAGELTASIAHEINQPLAAILTNADAAEMLLDSGADRRGDVRRILSDIRRDDLRASDVIRRLRALLAKHAVERKPLELNEMVKEVAALLQSEAARRGLKLDVRTAPAPAGMVGDPVQIQQVLINLMLNAMDAMSERPDERRAIVVAVEALDGGVGFAVRDRGQGIVAEHLPQLFDSFFSTKRRGMGLGLSIARTIVEAHGGRIRAESRPGEGSSFHVVFPEAGASGLPAPLAEGVQRA